MLATPFRAWSASTTSFKFWVVGLNVIVLETSNNGVILIGIEDSALFSAHFAKFDQPLLVM